MILADALQILRENVGIVAGDTYTFGDTILTVFLENSRAYIAELAPPEKIPLCQVQASAPISLTSSIDYRAFEAGVRMIDLTDNSGVISGSIATTVDILDFSEKVQVEDNSATIFFNGRLYTNHIDAMIETHRWSFDTINVNEDYVPVLFDGVFFTIRQDFSPSGGWTTSDRIHIRLTVAPIPLTTSDQVRRLPERYENYAIQLAYADIMLTAVGDVRYRDIKASILREIGIIRSGSEL